MDTNKYNTRVRQAISEEYVKCSKRKQELTNDVNIITVRLSNEADTLSYREYRRLETENERLLKMIETEKIKLDIWDMAREICLNIADELYNNDFAEDELFNLK